MKKEQFKHNLEKVKRINNQRRFLETIETIEKRIETIQKLNKIINK